MTKITYIPGEIANAAIDEHGNRKPVTRTKHIFDDVKNKNQAEVNADIDSTFALHQSEINALDSQNYVTVDSFSSLPATGAVDTIYRVSNWDGTQQDPTVYSEYAWNGSQYVHLSTKIQIGEVFDISAYHATGGTLATYADLASALGTNGVNVPESLQKGGMSIKFVQSSDNKYVQARCMAHNFTTDVTQWQGVDKELVAGSHNLAESGECYGAIDLISKEVFGAKCSDSQKFEGYYMGSNGYLSSGTYNTYYIYVGNLKGKTVDMRNTIFFGFLKDVPVVGQPLKYCSGESRHGSSDWPYIVPADAMYVCVTFWNTAAPTELSITGMSPLVTEFDNKLNLKYNKETPDFNINSLIKGGVIDLFDWNYIIFNTKRLVTDTGNLTSRAGSNRVASNIISLKADTWYILSPWKYFNIDIKDYIDLYTESGTFVSNLNNYQGATFDNDETKNFLKFKVDVNMTCRVDIFIGYNSTTGTEKIRITTSVWRFYEGDTFYPLAFNSRLFEFYKEDFFSNILDNDISSLDRTHRINDLGQLVSNSGYENLCVSANNLNPGKYYLKVNLNSWPCRISVGGYRLLPIQSLGNNVYSFEIPESFSFTTYIQVVLNSSGTALLSPAILSKDPNFDREELDTISLHYMGLTEKYSKNLIDPNAIQYDKRYSIGQHKMIAYDNTRIVSTGAIEVKEGQWYVISGLGVYSDGQGGYFANKSDVETIGTSSIQDISFVTPVDGVGKAFLVPSGLGIKYVSISLFLNSDASALNGSAQMEEGEQATAYTPYNLKTMFRRDYMPNTDVNINVNNLSFYTSFGTVKYPNIADKFPKFRNHWFFKDKDVVVVNTGTSLTARSGEHCTLRPDRAYRPPLMHSNNFASHIWDALKWEGQQYRRYDAMTEQGGLVPMFTEVGTFQTNSNISAWDDGPYREGYTRYTDSENASVAFVIPSEAYQFNFIYRTDSYGSEACIVTVQEGNGVLQVWNGTEWVEANGYSFSMREGAATIIPSITFIDPNSGNDTTLTNVQVKGNTTYQKRLKMRTVARTATKSVTISSVSGRLLYWGVEWSPRQYMITYINAARGSHYSLISNNAMSLIHYQDNDIWGFEPDLILSEDPIHNSNAGGRLSSTDRSTRFGQTTENFFFEENNSVSMVARCKTLLGQDKVPEFVLFNTSLTYNFGAFDTETGELYVTHLADGKDWTTLDAQMSCYFNVKAEHPNVVYINAVKNWVNAAIACYGNLAAATIGSGKSGETFTNEGSHWNDTGCKVMARIVLPVLDFLI